MSYCTPTQAQALVGQAISQTFLNSAMALIHRWTDFRWAATTEELTMSIYNNEGILYVRNPIVSVDSITVDNGSGTAASQTEDTDFFVRKDIGEITFPAGLPNGYDNVVITYTYGLDSSDEHYAAVQLAEAKLALHFKRNPAMLSRIGLEGAAMTFPPDLLPILILVPQNLEAMSI